MADQKGPIDLKTMILMSEPACRAFADLHCRLQTWLQMIGIPVSELPNAVAYIQEDRSLLIVQPLPRDKGSADMNVPAGDWTWAAENPNEN